MITESQRRALFALREALHLCEAAEVYLYPQDRDGRHCLTIESTSFSEDAFSKVTTEDVDSILRHCPEATA